MIWAYQVDPGVDAHGAPIGFVRAEEFIAACAIIGTQAVTIWPLSENVVWGVIQLPTSALTTSGGLCDGNWKFAESDLAGQIPYRSE